MLRRSATVLTAVLLASCAHSGDVADADAPGSSVAQTVQPGAPGEATRVISSEEATENMALPYTEADVQFMQGMIAHHAQALEMTALIADRTSRRDLMLLGQRIEISQRDEIRLMQNWLRRRGEEAPEATAHVMRDGEHMLMPGMLTMEQMDRLERSTGMEFYRLFLEYMISHHEGALVMVAELFSQEGAAQDTEVFRFASDVDVDQRMEITRMQNMLDATVSSNRP